MPTVVSTTKKEVLTEDLLQRLLATNNVDDYLSTEDLSNRELVSYLFELLHARGIKRADVVKHSGINSTVVYDIFTGKSKPGRNNAIMLAFGLGCNLRETQRLLRLAGVSELYCKICRDAILIWCIDHGYSREEADDELFRLKEKTLLGTGSLSA